MEAVKERAICPNCKTSERMKQYATSGPCAKYDDNGEFIPFDEYIITYHFKCKKCGALAVVDVNVLECFEVE